MHGRTSNIGQNGPSAHWRVTTEEFEALIDKARIERARYVREWFKSLFEAKPKQSGHSETRDLVGHGA